MGEFKGLIAPVFHHPRLSIAELPSNAPSHSLYISLKN